MNIQSLSMGYKVKIQKVDRGTTKSFYINFPAALAEASKLDKGEEMEWIVEDKNTFVLQRIKSLPSRNEKLEKQTKNAVKSAKKPAKKAKDA